MLGRSLQCDQNSENRTIVDTAWPFFLNWRKTLPLHTMPTIHIGCKNCVNANEWIGVTGWIHFSMLCTSNNNLCKHKFRMQMDDDSQWSFFLFSFSLHRLLFVALSHADCTHANAKGRVGKIININKKLMADAEWLGRKMKRKILCWRRKWRMQTEFSAQNLRLGRNGRTSF